MQCLSQCLGEGMVGDRVGRCGIEDSCQPLLHEMLVDPHQVIHMDPAGHHPPVPDDPSYPESERGDHLFEGTPVFAENDTEPQDGGGFAAFVRFLLPLLRETSQKVICKGKTRFVAGQIAGVDTDGGGGDEVLDLALIDRRDEPVRGMDTALSEHFFIGVAPASDDRRPRKVDDNIDPFELFQDRCLIILSLNADGIREGLLQGFAYKSACSGDGYFHPLPPLIV